MTKREKELAKKAVARKLRFFPEHPALIFGASASALIGAVLLLMSYSVKTGTFSPVLVGCGAIFLVEAALAVIAAKMVEKQVVANNAVSKGTRLFGWLLLLTIANLNFPIALGGLALLKEKKNTEYHVARYMVLQEVLVLIVSFINYFKPYVVNSFYVGVGVMIAVTIIHIICMVLVCGIEGNKADKKYMPLGIILIITSVTGNLFSFLLGLMVIRKCMTKDEFVSIGWIDVVKRLLKSQMAMIGAFIIVFLITLSICATFTFDYDIATQNNYMAILHEPCLEYPFGTDDYGRCIFTRVVFGARVSLMVGIFSTAGSLVLGVILGAIAGFYSGTIDNTIMRTLDVFMAIPGILLQIAIIAALGSSVPNMILALGIGSIPGYARVVRASILQLKGEEFVEAARACGAKDKVIIFKHLLPNSLAPLIIRSTLGIGGAVTAVSGLSYLGIGIQPHIPEWGNILKAGSAYLETAPYVAIFPGFAIVFLVLSFNFLGDGLRDALDPKLK